jgi:CoA:oxalate CoA-transferase
MARALEDIRVLTNTIGVMGPTCGMWLADLGAEVIRVEPPPPAGVWGTRRGKKSLTLNLKTDKGLNIFKDLAKTSDVILENYSTGVMERLGLGYEDIKEINPGIIYCSISGYGRTGPDKDLRGFDSAINARSGMMYSYYRTYEQPSAPVMIGTGAFTDYVGAIHGLSGILAALHYRNRTGKGQYIDISSLDVTISMNLFSPISRYIRAPHLFWGPYHSHTNVGAEDVRKTKDGKYIIFAILGPRIWSRALKLFGREDLIPKFQKVVALRPDEYPDQYLIMDRVLEEWVSSKTAEEAMRELRKAQIPSEIVRTIPEVVKDPHLRARRLFIEVDDTEDGDRVLRGKPTEIVNSAFSHMSETPGRISKNPYKEIGEDTEEILSNILGYSKEEINELERKGVTKKVMN